MDLVHDFLIRQAARPTISRRRIRAGARVRLMRNFYASSHQRFLADFRPHTVPNQAANKLAGISTISVQPTIASAIISISFPQQETRNIYAFLSRADGNT